MADGRASAERPVDPVPLSADEEAVWRALARAVVVIPRALEADLLEAEGITVTEYTVLMNLSEAPEHSLRMSELAGYVSISVSGLTRVVGRLEKHGLVRRRRSSDDGRGQLACLTTAGLGCLERAWPAHLASVRRHVVDHLGGLDLAALAQALAAVAQTEAGPPVRRGPR